MEYYLNPDDLYEQEVIFVHLRSQFNIVYEPAVISLNTEKVGKLKHHRPVFNLQMLPDI